MNIIYLSSCCTDNKFNDLFQKGYTKKLPQAQKYHLLLIEGLATCIDGKLTAISALPINRQWTKKLVFTREVEHYGNMQFIYNAFINLKGLRQFNLQRGTKKDIRRICKDNSECVIICDVLNYSLSKAALSYGNKNNIPVIGIVTDVPEFKAGARLKTQSFFNRLIAKYVSKLKTKALKSFDAFLFLTEQMNDVVNKNNKPYIVIEGHCDYKMVNVLNQLENKHIPKVIMYAGGIHEEFGIKRMVKAFLRGHFEDWELHIYGDGNYQEELSKIASKYSNVKYFGIQPNALIVENQLKATLLLNPRLTDAEYVKYSFPSKTLECMASGTPLLTTKLPGMPKEYYDFVYFFEDESENGMLETFKSILAKSPEEIHEFGIKARRFVLKQKNNVKQAKKFVDFLNDFYGKEQNDIKQY